MTRLKTHTNHKKSRTPLFKNGNNPDNHNPEQGRASRSPLSLSLLLYLSLMSLTSVMSVMTLMTLMTLMTVFAFSGCGRTKQQYIKRGETFLSKKEYNTAILEFKCAIKIDPD